MLQINIHEPKTQFSKLIASVEKGDEVIIARYGEPVAKLLPFKQTSIPRQPGSAKWKFKVTPEFFDPLPDHIIDAFEQ